MGKSGSSTSGLAIWMAAFGWLTLGCSVEQNTVTSTVYHNTTAHYNGYFYAREKTREVELAIAKSLDDDPNYVLALFPRLDTNLAKTYAKETEEMIRMGSISIQRHPNSKWVYHNYVLVGLARLYNCDYINAIQTFKYVNTKSKDPHLRHRAMIHLMRAFSEQAQFDRAEEVYRFLEKEKLSRGNAKDLFLEKAHLYQLKGDYDNMVRNLTGADSLLTRGDQKARLYFIVGQVYQKLGFNSEAYNYYKKCLTARPAYEIEFYARLNIAQVTKLDDRRTVKQARKQFEKLLADSKNAEFRDKIYYELAEFEQKQNHLPEAIENYKNAAHAGTNKRIQGSAFLRIGQLQFDSLRNYRKAKAYYDSALALLPKDFENYAVHKRRGDVLADFVKHKETIQLQDSLLRLAELDSVGLRNLLDSVYRRTLAKKSNEKKKRKSGSTAGASRAGLRSSLPPANTTAGTPDWYFDNPSALATGESEFIRIWGNLTLEDNWRRSNRSPLSPNEPNAVAGTSTTGAEAPEEATAESKDPVGDQFVQLSRQLPSTAPQKEQALKKIEDAYFQLGDLYFLKLNERVNAIGSYESILHRFPESPLLPEVLYKLFLIEKEHDPARSARYADRLRQEFPTTAFARILENPDYIREISVAAEQQKIIYKDAYEAFEKNNLRLASARLSEAESLGETGFTSQLDLLRVLITGKTEDVTRYQFELAEFAKKYPDSPLKAYSETLLAASKLLLERREKAKGIRFQNNWSGPMVFVLLHKKEDKLSDRISAYLEKILAQLTIRGPQTANLIFDETRSLTLLSEFSDIESARVFYSRFLELDARQNPLSGYKFDTFVISKDNFQVFYRTKASDEYLTFFDRNFQSKNP